MSGSRRSAQCRCTNAIYSGNYAESESDPDDTSTDARGSAAEVQDVDARRSLTGSRIESSVLFRDTSQQSLAVQELRKVDADRASKISMQNLKLSLLFPQASSRAR